MKKKRSPLKDKPLRYAGQSLDDQIIDKREDIFMWMIFTFVYLAPEFMAWITYRDPTPQKLGAIVAVFGVLAVITGSVSIVKVLKGFREIEKLIMARDGEKIVAEGLQELIGKGATIFNDIQANKFNIDHVVVSPRGIFLIETKTYSKPIKKDALISFDEENVYVDGRVIDRQPIRQARALSKWLQELLEKSTGRKFSVRPVILFPGWYTEKMKRGQEVWILNPKALPIFVQNEPEQLENAEVHLIAFHLSRYIRTC